jgi:hypothetical protein
MDGLYWVSLDDDEWTIAERERGYWWIIGCETPWREAEIEKIGPRIEPPTNG